MNSDFLIETKKKEEKITEQVDIFLTAFCESFPYSETECGKIF